MDTKNSPPQAYLDIVNGLMEQSKGMLERGESLTPYAFVGNLTTRQILAVQVDSSSDDAKERSSRTIKAAALHCDADFVFTIMEAWALRPDKADQYGQVIAEYGSIGASPYAIDVCSFFLETRYGVWMASPPILPKPPSKKKRTLGKIEFHPHTQTSGRFTHLLPARDEPSPTLH